MQRRGAFDLLLHLQLSLRASANAGLIPAPVKLGFDKPRARELQWLFTNRAHRANASASTCWTASSGFADALGVRAQAAALGHPAAGRRPRLRGAI